MQWSRPDACRMQTKSGVVSRGITRYDTQQENPNPSSTGVVILAGPDGAGLTRCAAETEITRHGENGQVASGVGCPGAGERCARLTQSRIRVKFVRVVQRE
jgi:hypothetical protein